MHSWRYLVEAVPGNFYNAVAFLNKHHPDWDVVTMKIVGDNTMIVYRINQYRMDA